MSYETILFEECGSCARLTLNRPRKLNSFTVQMHEEIRAALDQLDPGTRCLVITGAGRAFCSGQDLQERAAAEGHYLDIGESIEKNYAPLVRRLRALPIPEVAAVNGLAAGAGANLALACDIVVAARSAEFLEPFCSLGLIPDTGGTFFLPRLIGGLRAMVLALLSGHLSSDQAADWGLIWKCVDDAELSECVDEIAARLSASPRLALAHAKRANDSADNSLEEQLNPERDLLRELGNTADYRRSVADFLEKRTRSSAS